MYIIIGGDGKEYGPVTAENIWEWIRAGRANAETKIRRDGETEWTTLGALPEFASEATAPSPAAPPPPAPAEAAPAPTPASASTAGHVEIFNFTGQWEEYFKIWIVNLLLTIVTLGIYAAWAKVRNRRYFYANTKLFGHSFEYLADPVRILIGNIIVVAFFFGYSFSGVIFPPLQLVAMLALLAAMPWFITRALAFNARNTAWRGLRFQFHGTYGEALKAFVLWPILLPFTLGLIWPHMIQRQKAFLMNNHSYGSTRFEFSALTDDLYGIFFRTILLFLPLMAAYFMTIVDIIIHSANRHSTPSGLAMGLGVIGGFMFFLGIPLAIAGTFYLRSRLFNYVWNQTSLGGHQFTAHMRARDLFFTHLVNSIVTFCTFGLLHPWATLRMIKFHLDSLKIIQGGSIDDFVASAHPKTPNAIGEAASDLFDFDIGFGA